MTKMMKKSVVAFLMLVMTLSGTAYAEILWIDGGLLGAKQVSGGYEYQELCFITGEPVILKGIVTLPKVDKSKDKYSEKYSFELTNAAKGITLERDVTFEVVKEQSNGLSQTRFSKKLTKYEEEITTAGTVYTLGEYTFSDSRLYDNTLAVSYFSGNINASRKYYKNGNFTENQGFVTYDIETIPVTGYQHLWGDNETQKVKYTVKSYVPNAAYDPQKFGSEPYTVVWDGKMETGMNSTKKVVFDYQYTNPQNISFRGSFHKVTRLQNALVYEYNLPKSTSNATTTGRNVGKSTMSNEVLLESLPLIAPKVRDIGGHRAEEQINLLTSLELFAIDKEYFVPSAVISRKDFAKAVVGAVYGKLPEPTKNDVMKRRRPGVETPFLDVLPTDEDYHYMEFVKKNDVMFGKNGYFKGNETLTRAEAIAILVRALGIQYMAPAPPYKTKFVDDKNIPNWSKDYIYMASEVGLIQATDEGYINPNRKLTKADAAELIYDFIFHLKDVINYDYSEKILK